MDALSLRKNFSWTFFGNITYGACQFGIVAVIAKLGNPEILGLFSLSIAVATPIFLLFNLNLRVVQATDYGSSRPFQEYLALRCITTFAAILFATLLISSGIFDKNARFAIFIIVLAKGVEAITDVFYGMFQRQERMDKISISMALKGLLCLLSVFISLTVTDSSVVMLAAFTVSVLCSSLIYDIPNAAKFFQKRDYQSITESIWSQLASSKANLLRRLRQVFLLSLPAAGLAATLSISLNAPKYFVEIYLGNEDLGFFSALLYLPTTGIIVTSALGQSALPRLSKFYTEGKNLSFTRLIVKLVLISACMGIAGVAASYWFGPQILEIVYTKDYAQYSSIFVLLMTMAMINYVAVILSYGALATRSFKNQFLISTFLMLITLFSSDLLIQNYGLRGSAMSQMINASGRLVGWLLVILLAFRESSEEKIKASSDL